MAERQMATRLEEVRADHTWRYHWAAERLSGNVIDAACGCGYGSAILAEAGLEVVGVDVSAEAIEWAARHWSRPSIEWLCADVTLLEFPPADAVVSFETVEHLADPRPFLRALRAASPRLLASVPNQAKLPFTLQRFPHHHRHYTATEFEALLNQAGWRVTGWWGQQHHRAPVKKGGRGRTLVVEAARA